MKFRGWIPTVTGRLSFDVIGDSKYPTQAVSANVACKNYRYFICYQKRPLLDVVLPAKYLIGNLLFGLEGKFVFLCLGRSSNNISASDGSLVGSLYIIDIHMWRNTVKDLVDSKIDTLKSLGSSPSLYEDFDSTHDKLRSTLQKSSYYCVDYKLNRDGVLDIEVDEKMILSSDAPNFPEEAGEKSHVQHIICSQLFFFLKDIVHNHQHHEPSTDTVLDIYRVDDGDDYLWRCEVLRLLYRKVLQYKRNRREEIFSSALGTLAYIKTFKVISEESLTSKKDPKYIANGSKIVPDLQHDNLKESILASQSALRNSIQDKIRVLDVVRNTLIGFIGAVVALVGLVKLTNFQLPLDKSSKVLIFLATQLTCNPVITISVICSMLCVVLMVLGVINPYKWKWLRGSFKLLVSLDRKYAAALYFLAAAVIMGSCYWFAIYS